MLVSIIIPVYNVQDYIVKCLESVAAQTYNGAMECLIIDDCGQDESIRLAEEFVETYQGTIDFRIIHHDYNKGLSAARNTGIRESKGDWLYFLDSDDWIISECIQFFVDCCILYPLSDLVVAGAFVSKAGSFLWADIEKKELPEFSCNRDWIQKQMLSRYVFGMTSWNKLIYKKFLLENSIWFIEGIKNEDEVFNFELAKYTNAISILKKNTYMYVVRDNSLMSSSRNTYYLFQRYIGIWRIIAGKIGLNGRDNQARGLYGMIHELTYDSIPKEYSFELSYILFIMSIRVRSKMSIPLLIQSFLAFCHSRYFFNNRNRRKLIF